MGAGDDLSRVVVPVWCCSKDPVDCDPSDLANNFQLELSPNPKRVHSSIRFSFYTTRSFSLQFFMCTTLLLIELVDILGQELIVVGISPSSPQFDVACPAHSILMYSNSPIDHYSPLIICMSFDIF